MLTRGAATIVVALLALAAGHLRAQTPAGNPLGLQFSTYLGGSANDSTRAIAVDETGAAYVAIVSSSVDFGDPLFLPSGQGRVRARTFLLKIGLTGTVLYSRVFDESIPTAIAADASGGVVLAVRPPDDVSPDIIRLWRLDSAGTAQWTLTFGGNGQDTATSLAFEGDGNILVSGSTDSTDFPTAAAVPSTCRDPRSGFVARVSAAGAFLAARCIPGTSFRDVALDPNGDIYVTGSVSFNSPPLPVTVGAVQSTYGGGSSDMFIARLARLDFRVLYASYFGGLFLDQGWAVAVDSGGRAYFGGMSRSEALSTRGVFQEQCVPGGGGCADGLLVKLTPGGQLEWATYLGGPRGVGVNDAINALSIAADGDVYAAGTGDELFPFPRRRAVPRGGTNTLADDLTAFVVKIRSSGTGYDATVLEHATGDQMAVNRNGMVWVGGITRVAGYPLMRPLQSRFGGGDTDATIALLAPVERRRWP